MATWIVNTNAETGSVVGNEGPLKSVIDAATSGDTIVFDTTQFLPNTETTISFSSTKEIQKSLIIDATHDANGDEISGATWLDNGVLKTRVVINLQGGAYRAFGFQVNSNYTYVLRGLTFYNGVSAINGGLLYLRFGELTINDCVLKSVSTSLRGGGIYLSSPASATLTNCTFDACSASSNGGGVYIDSAVLSLNNCTFNACNGSSQGGGINIAGGTSSVTINNSRFTNCVATNGGSIYCNGTVNVTNTNFISQDSNTNVLLNSTTTTFSDVTANAISINASASVIISGALSVNVLTTKTGTTVTFNGVDSVLEATDSATINAATFTADSGSNAKAIFPASADLTSATFTNVAPYLVVTSTAETGAGTLNGALTNAKDGTTIIFDDSLEVDGVITIELESQIQLPARNITIDGGGHTGSGATLQPRVIFDGQGATLLFYTYTSKYCNFKDVTFKNGYGNAGGAVRSRNNNVTTNYNYCVFDSCVTTGGGGALYLNAGSSNVISNCVFKNCESSNGASIWQSGTSANEATLVINNCIFGDTTSPSNVYNSSTTCPLIIQGIISIDKITFGDGALVTFDGVDTVLTVKTTFTDSGATFSAAANSRGYLAIPSDATPPTVGAGVKTATYSGGVSAISASVNERTATLAVTNSTAISPLIEYRSSGDTGTWTTLNVVDNQATIGDDRAFKVRAFDGAKFVEGTTVPRTYYYQGSASSGSFGIASDWAMDSAKTLTCNATPTIAGGTFDCR